MCTVTCQQGKKKTLPSWNGVVTNENRNLAEIPPLKTRLALQYETERLFGSFEWIHSEAASRVDIDAGEVDLPAWDAFNLRVGYQPRDFITLNFGVDNLFDECYAVANSYEFDVVSGSLPVGVLTSFMGAPVCTPKKRHTETVRCAYSNGREPSDNAARQARACPRCARPGRGNNRSRFPKPNPPHCGIKGMPYRSCADCNQLVLSMYSFNSVFSGFGMASMMVPNATSAASSTG